MVSTLVRQISHVKVYAGHITNPLFGPYRHGIEKRMRMFEHLNTHRLADGKQPWKVEAVFGEQLIDTMRKVDPMKTLFVVPAGESTKLDQVFSREESDFINYDFFGQGGRGYFTCGASYWAASKRIYKDLCEEQPTKRQTLIKTSKLPLFEGIAEGPLCPYPGKEYKIGFYSDAIRVHDNNTECTVFLGGGGSFLPDPTSKQKVAVLARYNHSELLRNQKREDECEKWENAAIMVSIGRGAAVFSMFHPYYGPDDINVEAYTRAFPNCGTNWQDVKNRLSPLDVRMNFVYHNILGKLETQIF
jgi:glutamine amidotransferase-like uncharacterized protein